MRLTRLFLLASLVLGGCGTDPVASGTVPLDSEEARRAVEALSEELQGLKDSFGPHEITQVWKVEGAEDRFVVIVDYENPTPSENDSYLCGDNDGWLRGGYFVVDFALHKQAGIGHFSAPWAGCGATSVTADASNLELGEGVTQDGAEWAVEEMLNNLWANEALSRHPFVLEGVGRSDRFGHEAYYVRLRFETPFSDKWNFHFTSSCSIGHPDGDMVTGAGYYTPARDGTIFGDGTQFEWGFVPRWTSGVTC